MLTPLFHFQSHSKSYIPFPLLARVLFLLTILFAVPSVKAGPLKHAQAISQMIIDDPDLEATAPPLHGIARQVIETAKSRPEELEITHDFTKFDPATHSVLLHFSALYRQYQVEGTLPKQFPRHYYYAPDPRILPTETAAESNCVRRAFGGHFFSSAVIRTEGILPFAAQSAFLFCPAPHGIRPNKTGGYCPFILAYPPTLDFYHYPSTALADISSAYEAWQQINIASQSLFSPETRISPPFITALRKYHTFFNQHRRKFMTIPLSELQTLFRHALCPHLSEEEGVHLAKYHLKLHRFFTKMLPLYVQLYGALPMRMREHLLFAQLYTASFQQKKIATLSQNLLPRTWHINTLPLLQYESEVCPPPAPTSPIGKHPHLRSPADVGISPDFLAELHTLDFRTDAEKEAETTGTPVSLTIDTATQRTPPYQPHFTPHSAPLETHHAGALPSFQHTPLVFVHLTTPPHKILGKRKEGAHAEARADKRTFYPSQRAIRRRLLATPDRTPVPSPLAQGRVFLFPASPLNTGIAAPPRK